MWMTCWYGEEKTEQHDVRCRQVLDRCRERNLKLNKDKCRFRVSEVSYVGHVLSADGVKPDPLKVEAIRAMPPPGDREELQRFLGVVTYLSKFIPNMSQKSVLHCASYFRKMLNGPGDRQKMKHLKASRQQFHPHQSLSSSTPKSQYLCRLMPVQRA